MTFIVLNVLYRLGCNSITKNIYYYDIYRVSDLKIFFFQIIISAVQVLPFFVILWCLKHFSDVLSLILSLEVDYFYYISV